MKTYPREITIDEIKRLLAGNDSPTILEIGAHQGDQTELFAEAFPKGFIFAFEPDPRPFRRLFARTRRYPNVNYFQRALGNVNDYVPWYSSHGDTQTSACVNGDWDYSSSLKQPTGHLQRSPEITFAVEALVPCERLDDVKELQKLAKPFEVAFAWIDVQGAQREVIEGGRKTLDATKFIYLECHWTPLYEGETTFDELCRLLPGHTAVARYEENILFERLG